MAAHWVSALGFGPFCVPSEQDGALIWLFKRNCSMSPKQLLMFFVSLSLVSLFVAMLCWAAGAKLVTPFTVLELLVLGWALFVYARHAADRERVVVSAQSLVIEWESAGRVERAEFNPRWARIVVGAGGLIEISGAGQVAFIGRYTRPERREKLARDLRRALLVV